MLCFFFFFTVSEPVCFLRGVDPRGMYFFLSIPCLMFMAVYLNFIVLMLSVLLFRIVHFIIVVLDVQPVIMVLLSI